MDFTTTGSGVISIGGLSDFSAIGFKFAVCDDAYPKYTIVEFNELEQIFIKKRLVNTGF